jgi:hypothetical protein
MAIYNNSLYLRKVKESDHFHLLRLPYKLFSTPPFKESPELQKFSQTPLNTNPYKSYPNEISLGSDVKE